MSNQLNCGAQHHFIASCRFHLATFIGDRLVSTVGDYYPHGSEKRDTVGWGRFYETFVFVTDNDWSKKEQDGEAWEHPDVTDWEELDSRPAQTAAEATKNHWEMVALKGGNLSERGKGQRVLEPPSLPV